MIWISHPIRRRGVVVAAAFAVMVGSIAGVGEFAQPARAQTMVDSQESLEAELAGTADVIQLTGSFVLDGTPITIDRDVMIKGLGALASDSTMTVVKANGASAGQAFIVTSGSVTFENLAITGADTRNKGGALQIDAGASVNLDGVYLHGNSADEGGAIFNAGTLVVDASTIEANSSSRKGGGIESDGTLTVLNSTFTSNIGKGGGAISVAGTAALSFVTVVSNTSTNKIGAGILRNGGTVAVKNSIVANNVDQSGDFHDCSGSPDFDSVLLSSDQGCNPTGDFLVVSEVMFGPLGIYGGGTPTLPLQDNSDGTLHPAVALAGDCADLAGSQVGVDQRGVIRPQGTGCDAGAYERDQTPPVVTATSTPEANTAGWNNEPVSIALEANEPATIEYSLDGVSWVTYDLPFSITGDGITTVAYRATDVDGNESSPESIVISIDVTAPTVAATQTAGASEGDIDVTLDATDALSGVESITYQIDSNPATETTEDPITLTIADTGTTTITYSATDIAGNTSNPQTTDVTIDPLSLAVTLDTSVSEIEVGAVTVPLVNIPEAIRNAAGMETTTASTPLSAIPLSAIPLSAIETSSTPLSAIPLSAIPLSAIPLSAIGDTANTLTAIPLSAIPLSAIPLSAIDTATSPLVGTPLSAIPLSAILLSDIGTNLLSDGENDIDLSLEELLAGSDLQDTPAQSLTFEDLATAPLSAIDFAVSPLSAIPLSAIPLSAIANVVDCSLVDCATTTLGELSPPREGTIGDVLGFDDVNFASTPLSAIPLSAIALGTLPLSAIPLSAIDSSGTTLTGLDAWCELLGAQLCADLSITSSGDNGVSLMTLALAGVPLSAIPLSAIDLTDIPLSAIPLSAIPLSAIDFSATPLSAIDVDLFDPALCAPGCGPTLRDVTVEEFGDTTIGDLESGMPPGYSLADLLFGIIGAGSIPWQDLDLQASRLPDAAVPKQPTFDYQIGIVVGGARTASVDVVLDIPAGFVPAYDAEPQLLATGPPPSSSSPERPAEVDGILTFTGLELAPGSYTLTIPMRAGVVLGDFTASVTADGSASGSTAAAGPATASITVVEAGEGGPIPVIQDGNLELSHISVSDDIDLYSFSVGEGQVGASAEILLSNLPVDFDLTLYGPPLQAPLRGEPTVGYGTIEDFRYDLNPDDDALDQDALEDVLNAPPFDSVRQAVSATRGTSDELIETGTLREGDYFIQVSSYNGVISNDPFALRVRLSGSTLGPCAATSQRAGLTPAGSMPAYPDGLNTLFLYNSAWLADSYEPGNAVFTALNNVSSSAWTDLGVIAAAVPVDADAAVWSALQAWDADRCDPLAPNDVVREIGDLIDSIRTTHPTLENIVIVGDDSQIPFARIPDGVSVSNETEHGRTIKADGELKRALSGGYYFSDDPYGASRGITVADHEFFVPELAVGRLVETPAQIAGLMNDFVTYGGVLDPDTSDGSFAAVSGYDFLSDGTNEVIDGLVQGGFTIDVLNNETWTRQDLIGLLSGAGIPAGQALTSVSVNAHFDETRALPAFGNANSDESDLFTTSDLPAGLTRSMIFSMGCHSGLSVSDVQIGSGVPDWAESFASQGNLYAANSGYGYGDTKVVAYSEQISAYFAQYLPSMSVGEAWVAAKQRFASQLFTLTPYHEKVSQEFIFYGLPMFRAVASATGPSTGPAASASGPAVINDPFGDGEVAPVAITLSEGASSAPGTLHLVETDEGDYYEVDGETLMVRGRPVQPLTGLDVTRPDGAGGTVATAAGAFITGLVGRQVTGFDPLVFDPIVDLGDAEAPLRNSGTRFSAGDTTFPAGLQRVVSYIDESGQVRDRLVVVPGRYKSDGSTQELFTSIEALIHYRDPNSSDFTAPFIRQSLGRYGAGIAHFEIDVRGDEVTGEVDDVERVYVLFRPKGQTASTEWLGVDLARVPGTTTWLGGRPVVPFTDTDYEFFVQAVDGNGNISTATSKGVNFLTIQPTSDANITITTTSTKFATGWYDSLITANATSAGATITSYVLDGIEFPGSGNSTQSIPISGDGGHLLLVFDSAGRQGVFFAAIDQTVPEVTATVSPQADGGWIGTSSEVTIVGSDLFGSGVVAIEYSLDGGTPVLVQGNTATVTVDATTTMTYEAIDGVDRRSAIGSTTVQIDTSPPIVTPSVSPAPNASDWINSPATVTLTADDEGRSGVGSIEYSVDNGTTWVTVEGDAATLTTTLTVSATTTITYRATDLVGNTSTPGSITVQVDTIAPTINIVSPDGSYPVGSTVTASFDCSDSGSGIASCVGSVANGGSIDTTTAGTFTFTVTATDIAGLTTVETTTYSIVDSTPPEITITSPIEGELYVLGESLAASFTCTDDSGVVATCTADIDGTPIANGAAIPTDVVGTFTLTVTASDAAGNQTSESVTYTVGYGICLLYDPAREQPATGAVAIKFQICDAAGTNLSKANIMVTAVSLSDASGPLDLDPQDSGQSNSAPTFEFRYDAKLKGYIYNLNQDPPLAPGSYTLGFTVGSDPTIYEAPFILK